MLWKAYLEVVVVVKKLDVGAVVVQPVLSHLQVRLHGQKGPDERLLRLKGVFQRILGLRVVSC